MKVGFIFPGQGSQYVGMGKELIEQFSIAKETLQEIDEALERNLTNIILNGPAEQLTQTINTQPALMGISLAVIRVLINQYSLNLDKITYVAGHSLGEYSALAAVGSISVRDTAKLLKIRSQSMQEAVPENQATMAAIIGGNFELIDAIAKESSNTNNFCQIANYNSKEQIVISGHNEAVELAMQKAIDKNLKAIRLKVSAPFHCSLMKPAQQKMQIALDKQLINQPIVPLIANISASPIINPLEIKQALVDQVVGTVRWYQTIEYMISQQVTHFIEIGAGRVLSNLNKRITNNLFSMSIEKPNDCETLAKILDL